MYFEVYILHGCTTVIFFRLYGWIGVENETSFIFWGACHPISRIILFSKSTNGTVSRVVSSHWVQTWFSIGICLNGATLRFLSQIILVPVKLRTFLSAIWLSLCRGTRRNSIIKFSGNKSESDPPSMTVLAMIVFLSSSDDREFF